MNKRIVMIGLLFLISQNCFVSSMPARYIRFYVKNMTTTSIMITSEVAPPDTENFSSWESYYYTENNERIIFVVPIFEYEKQRYANIIIPSGESSMVFRWVPTKNWEQIPTLQRLKLFYSTLIIKDNDNNILKTINTITEDEIVVNEYGEYFLLIK